LQTIANVEKVGHFKAVDTSLKNLQTFFICVFLQMFAIIQV